VEEGNATGSGWAYGWAAVALLVIFCGILMVEFMEHYFVRGWRGFDDDDVRRNKKEDDRLGGEEVTEIRFDGDIGKGVNWKEGRDKMGNLLRVDKNVISSLSPKNICNRTDPFRRHGGKSLLDLRPSSPLAFFKTKPKSSKPMMEMEDEEDDETPFLGVEDEIVFQRNDDVETKMVEALKKKSVADSVLSSTNSKAPKNLLLGITLKERVEALLEREENQTCVDCPNRFPRWASIIVPLSGQSTNAISNANNLQYHRQSMGCFCCTDCAASHRRLGTHILFVRSIDHDRFKEQEVRALEEGGGNIGINRIYEAKLRDKSIKPQSSAHSWTRESFTTIKYQRKQWADFNLALRNSDMMLQNGGVPKNGIREFHDDVFTHSSSSSCSSSTKTRVDDDNLTAGLIELVKSPSRFTDDLTGDKNQSTKSQKATYTSLVTGYESDSGSEFFISGDEPQQQQSLHGHPTRSSKKQEEVQLGLISVPGNIAIPNTTTMSI